MRIIAGEHRGLQLATPRGREVRPILDRVRESLFGILRHAVPDARVADLFAGTGVIGLEALSRGAASCLFVDRDPRCVATIRENVRRARLEQRARVARADAFRARALLAQSEPFSLVFVDPPYRMMRGPRNFARVIDLLAELGECSLLHPAGTLVLRFPADVKAPAHAGPLAQTDRRRYGAMKIALFTHS